MATLPDSCSITALIAGQARADAPAPAIVARGRRPLGYAELSNVMCRTAGDLRRLGYGPGHRVAVVMPNGPEMAAACLSVAAAGTCVPLNPAYTESEAKGLMERLGVSVVLVTGEQGAARGAANALSIPVHDIVVRAELPAGTFHVETGAEEETAAEAETVGEGDFPGGDDVALVLHTSGSTAEPKIVPLTHRNLVESAGNVARSLRLGPGDVCLNTMPLFHVGGLVDLLLAPLGTGGTVAVGADMGAAEFFACLEELRPTWYQGVPTMLQDLLRHGDQRGLQTAGNELRLIRSVSAPLPEPTLHELEKRFGVPVIEIYGMTETAGVITSNPLPPGERRVGSVGVAAGPEVTVVDAAGNAARPGARGEVVVRGPSVMSGYERAPGICEETLVAGWLRTGDEGYFDADGYLYLTGRMKDIINRGGEKISPREIDEVVLAFPGVAEAAAFASSHPTLGEEVSLAVVPLAGRSLDVEALKAFCGERLARFKVPRVVHVCKALPKAPGGKLQRGRLPDWCVAGGSEPGSTDAGAAPPLTARQELLIEVWREVLGATAVGVDDDFVDLGGDSLRAVELAVRMSERLGSEVPAAAVYDHPTIGELDAALDSLLPEASPVAAPGVSGSDGEQGMLEELRQIVGTWEGLRASEDGLLVGWNTMGSRAPLFWGVQGFPDLRELAEGLGPDQPVWGMRSLYETRSKSPENTAALARRYRAEIERVQPEGAVHLAGYCAGGAMALEIARLLWRDGREVASLSLVEHFQARPYDGRVSYLFAAESGWHPFKTADAPWLELCTGGPVVLHPSRATHVDMLSDTRVIEALRRDLDGVDRPRAGAAPGDLLLSMEATAPRYLVSRRPVRLHAEIANPGAVAWPAASALFARWARPGSGCVVFDHAAEMGRRLEPGDRRTIELEVRAPLAPGPWKLEVLGVYGGDWSAGGFVTPFGAVVTVLPGAAIWSYVREEFLSLSKMSLALRRLTGRTA